MPIRTVDPVTLKQWLDHGQATLLDVREPAEYRARHIAPARNIPLAAIAAAHLPGNGAIVIHCQKGGRGASACEKLLQQNPALEIFNLEGGIEAWAAAGLPTSAQGRAILPLDRQVQLTIGILLLIASGLTLFVDIWFLLAVAAIGIGLSVAGATGFCGMARLLAHAPWNR
jgi:rhodanese-related sulfurtransferase